jgi:NADPH-dependent curcumin reductase CurA
MHPVAAELQGRLDKLLNCGCHVVGIVAGTDEKQKTLIEDFGFDNNQLQNNPRHNNL